MKFKLPGLGFLKRGKNVEDLDEYEDWEDEGDDDDDDGGIAPEAGFPGSEEEDTSDEDVIIGDGADDLPMDDDEGFAEEEPSETLPAVSSEEPPSAEGEEDYDEDDYIGGEPDFDDEDDEAEGGGFKEKMAGLLAPLAALGPKVDGILGTGKRRIAILSVAGLLGLGLLGGLGYGVYAMFAGNGEEEVAEEAGEDVAGGEDLGDKLRRRNVGLGLKTLDESGVPEEEGPPPEVPGAQPFGAQPFGGGGEEEQGGTGALSLNEIARQEAASSISGVMVAAVPKGSYARLPKSSEGEVPLDDLPNPGLIEQRGTALLPITDPAGHTSFKEYARPAEIDAQQPAVAIIVGGLALARNPTEAAIWNLPGAVTLAFEAYGANLEAMVSRARQAGHEVLLTVPMASEAFPIHDPGPQALQVALDPMENTTRLEEMLASMTRYAGVLGTMGSSIVTRDDMIRPILTSLKERGLMYVDGGRVKKSLAPGIASEIGLPRAMISLEVDDDPSRAAIDARLAELERLAREGGAAVGLASPYPSTLERLNVWIQSLPQKGLVLAPVTALADRQMATQ